MIESGDLKQEPYMPVVVQMSQRGHVTFLFIKPPVLYLKTLEMQLTCSLFKNLDLSTLVSQTLRLMPSRKEWQVLKVVLGQ